MNDQAVKEFADRLATVELPNEKLEIIRDLIVEYGPINQKTLTQKFLLQTGTVNMLVDDSQVRQVREQVRQLRLAGVPVLSNHKGYFMPRTADEVIDILKRIEREAAGRAKSSFETHRALRDAFAALDQTDFLAELDQSAVGFDLEPAAGKVFVAVYGTLRRGFSNHGYLSGSKLVGSGKTVQKYTLRENGIPFVNHTPATSQVVVEVYEVDMGQELANLDRLEGHPQWYVRELTPISLDGLGVVNAWLYFNDDANNSRINPTGDFAKTNRNVVGRFG